MRRKSLRIFFAISCLFGLIIDPIDIVGAYLESFLGDNKLPIFMKLPLGMERFRSIRPGLVCRLLCSIYGFKQSGRLWNQKVVVFFESLVFRALNSDPSLLIHQEGGGEIIQESTGKGITMVSVYIDDFLLASKN